MSRCVSILTYDLIVFDLCLQVSFLPHPSHRGLITGHLDVHWQSSSQLTFHLQAFVGQPLEFSLSPRAFFPPAVVGYDTAHGGTSSFEATVFNASPYNITWTLASFGAFSTPTGKAFRATVSEEDEELHEQRRRLGIHLPNGFPAPAFQPVTIGAYHSMVVRFE